VFEAAASEPPAFVGDDVPGWAPHLPDRSIQKALNVARGRTITEEREADKKP
jgi:hypothetical protein